MVGGGGGVVIWDIRSAQVREVQVELQNIDGEPRTAGGGACAS